MFKGFYNSPFIAPIIARSAIPIIAQNTQANPYLLEDRGLTAQQQRAEYQRAYMVANGNQMAPLPATPQQPTQIRQSIPRQIQPAQQPAQLATPTQSVQQQQPAIQTVRRAPPQQIPENPIYTIDEIENLYRGQSEESLRYALDQLSNQEESKDPQDQANTQTQIQAINNLLNEMLPNQQQMQSNSSEQSKAVGIPSQNSNNNAEQAERRPSQLQQLKQEIIRNPPDVFKIVSRAYDQYKKTQDENDLKLIKSQLQQLDIERLKQISKLDPHELESAITVRRTKE